MDLSRKIAIVTGAGRGIGSAVAERLAEYGAKVAVVSNVEKDVAEVTETIKNKGHTAIGINCDVAVEAQVKDMVKKVENEFGEVNVLINNAGVGWVGSLQDTKVEEWDLMMDVNLKGVFLCSREVVGNMIKAKSGKIISTASKAGHQAFGNLTAYCTSKYGVVGFTESLARELSEHHINVNAVCPDSVVTAMSIAVVKDADRTSWMQPEDIADIYAYLSSDESNMVNGAIINAYKYAGLMGQTLKL